MSLSLIPAKKLYEWLYSRTWPRQNRQYSFASVRPLGARWVAAALQFGHSQAGQLARKRRSRSGLTLIRSNSGESFFMTDHYADGDRPPARLDKADWPMWRHICDDTFGALTAAHGRRWSVSGKRFAVRKRDYARKLGHFSVSIE